ncbi:fucolectin-like [Hyperolius riggenbachi]|uniref:fucolectin-like n=1 Tax=Hyperolius riggenbachi TaxID=752182 RepID=UPI0035A39C27
MKKRSISLPILILLLVSVDAQFENLALRGRATMSSIYLPDGPRTAAIHAIDGNTDPINDHGSCFSTDNQFSPWWRVDLLESYIIFYVAITVRGDCCAEYITGAEILIGDSLASYGNDNPRCALITSLPLGATQTYYCPWMRGRYVNVALLGRNGVITFCEIQIFGVATSDVRLSAPLNGSVSPP